MNKNKPFKLTLFGGFRLVDKDGVVLLPGPRKSRALLAWLAVNQGREYPREKLALLLWPDSDEAAARHSLRQALTGLKKLLPAETRLLKTSKDFISLNSDEIETDVQDFLSALSKGDSGSLDYAIQLYSGEFLEGCNPHSDMFDEWGMAYRNEFKEKAVAAIDLRLSQYLEKESYEQVIELAIRLIAIDSVRESAYRALMLAHIYLGNHASALRWYRRCEDLLKRELDVTPDPETQALYLTELRHDDLEDKSIQNSKPVRSSNKSTKPDWLNNISTTVSKENQRVVYQIKMAMDGIIDQIGGQSILMRGEAGVGKSVLASEIMSLAKSQGFFCCRKNLSDTNDALEEAILRELKQDFSNCLLNYPIDSNIENRNSCDIKTHKNMVDQDIASLVEKTSALQPVLLIVEHIHEAKIDTLNLLAKLISSAGNNSMLLLMTSQFKGEPLDPVWRGAMRGAPLTTIDMS